MIAHSGIKSVTVTLATGKIRVSIQRSLCHFFGFLTRHYAGMTRKDSENDMISQFKDGLPSTAHTSNGTGCNKHLH
jgi:hypothetical protein